MNEITITCQPHQNNVEYVDLNKVSQIKGRLACQQCKKECELHTFIGFKKEWENIQKQSQDNILTDVSNKQFSEFSQEELIKIAEYISQYKNQENLQVQQNDYPQIGQNLTLFKILSLLSILLNIGLIISLFVLKSDSKKYSMYFSDQECPQCPQFPQCPLLDPQQLECQQCPQRPKCSQHPRINYLLVSKFQIASNDCRYFSFNHELSIMLISCETGIKVLNYTNGVLNLNQEIPLKGPVEITLMKNSNEFISSFYDEQQSMVLWQKNDENQWSKFNQLNSTRHGQEGFDLIITNQNENLIIKCQDNYGTIEFWVKNDQWKLDQTLILQSPYCLQLSLNDNQDQLIVSEEFYIEIFNREANNQWSKFQTIKINAINACFTENNKFIVKTQTSLNLFEWDGKKYQKTTKIKKLVSSDNDGGFLMQFIKQKSILIYKNNQKIQYIEISKKQTNYQDQEIFFGYENHVFGDVTNDGEHLITWDNDSQEVQVRKYEEI